MTIGEDIVVAWRDKRQAEEGVGPLSAISQQTLGDMIDAAIKQKINAFVADIEAEAHDNLKRWPSVSRSHAEACGRLEVCRQLRSIV